MANLIDSSKYLDLTGLGIYDSLIKGVITAGDQANADNIDTLATTVINELTELDERVDNNTSGISSLNTRVASLETSTSDWNENDPTSLSYIKNRTHYEETSERILYTGNIAPAWNHGDVFFQIPLDSLMQSGEEIEMKFTQRGADGPTVLRGIAGDEGMVSLKTSYPSGPSASLYNEYQQGFGKFNLVIYDIIVPQDTDFEIEIKAVNTTVHVLDEKFIPATIARTGTLAEDDAKTLEAINDELNGIDTKIATLNGGKEDKMPVLSILSGSTSVSCLMGTYYTFEDQINTMNIILPTTQELEPTIHTIVFFMTIGATPAITFNSTLPIYYHDGFGFVAGKTYEVNALFNGSAWVISSVKIIIPTTNNEE